MNISANRAKDIVTVDTSEQFNPNTEDPEVAYPPRPNKSIDETWDFKGVDTKEFTHCFHAYPAMMIPQVARRIISEFGSGVNEIFDPYCGTGTSLVEANLAGINAVGTDLNPLARLLASAKTTLIDIHLLQEHIHQFRDLTFNLDFTLQIPEAPVPEIKNAEFWFSPLALRKLAFVRSFILEISQPEIQNFFFVAFSETVRESSYTKKREFKLVRNREIDPDFNPNVFGIMESKLQRNLSGLARYQSAPGAKGSSRIFDFNTVDGIPSGIFRDGLVDMVVTSPPYGDSSTTVAYGQYSRLANEWLGVTDANQIDNRLMGGRKSKSPRHALSPLVEEVCNIITAEDPKRALDVIAFYQDYAASIANVAATIRPGGYACYVVGNRTVKGLTIPTDEITARLFEANGFRHLKTNVRNIPGKRMPLKNSPSNVPGQTGATMKNEYIVICQKTHK